MKTKLIKDYRKSLRRGHYLNLIKPPKQNDSVFIVYLIVVLLSLIIYVATAHSQIIEPATVDINAIIQIESGGDPNAYEKWGPSYGLMQVSEIVLKEWNQYHPGELWTPTDLFTPSVNVEIGSWYLRERIPQMLAHFKKPITLENIIISYNAGISYVVHDKDIPSTTKKYIEKYRRLTK